MDRSTQSSLVLYGAAAGPGRRSARSDPDLELASLVIRAERRVNDLIASFDAAPIDPGKDEIGRYMEEDLRGAELSILTSAAGSPETWWPEEVLKEHARVQSGSNRAGPMLTFALRRLVEDGYLERDGKDAVRISL